jgi:hypothetical protein
MKICSLLPSATEVIASLGLSHELVGISHECDYPPSVSSVPIMVEPTIPPHGLASPDPGPRLIDGIELLAAILHPSDHDHIHESMAYRLGPLPIHQRP